MLRLPPTLRAAVAASCNRPFTQPAKSLRWSNALTRTERLYALQHVSACARERRRTYATVHVEDTERLWNSHGKVPAPGPTQRANPDPERSELGPDAESAPAQKPPVTVNDTEKQKLLLLLNRKARGYPARRRSAHKQRIRDALESVDPLTALKGLLSGSAHNDAVKDAERDDMPTVSTASDDKPMEVMDMQRIQATKPLPTKDQYPQAPETLFDPPLVASAIHNACQKLKVSIQIETNFRTKQGMRNQTMQVCTLDLDIPDICQEHAEGEGTSKQQAKQSAWLQVVSKMHVDETLKELFPEPNIQHRGEKSIPEPDQPLLKAAQVDKQTLQEQKDAKSQIYDYCAGLGLVPEFENKVVQARAPRARRGQQAKQPKPLLQVTLRLKERGIEVVAAGKDLNTAEIAAALAFKNEAEKHHLTSEDSSRPPSEPAFSVLNADTAKDFFQFARTQRGVMNVEVEHEGVSVNGTSQNRGIVTVNGEPVGSAVLMHTKKEAESCAYLVAAVEIAKSDLKLLHEFEQVLQKGKGKLLRTMRAIDLQVDYDALQAMRNGLVEARNAGLPDARQVLTAEAPDLASQRRSRRRRLTPNELLSANKALTEEKERFAADPALEDLRLKKASLPMSQYRDQVLGMVSDHMYSIVVGATGSGKTTQVPQILFEHAIDHGTGSACNIICTQPRRIAATSVAQRVAEERNERLQKNVGYQVRFDSKLTQEPHGITYCTTGILLEKLKHDPDDVLETASHILIDEVHERDLNIDFLMVILKRAIRNRQNESKSVPRVILMSATLDTELFANYFSLPDGDGKTRPCPALSVPGRTYPVKEKFLGSIMDEMLSKHGSQVRSLLATDPKTDEYLKVETAFSASRSRTSQTDSVIDWKRERQAVSDSDEEVNVAHEKEDALVPVSLLAATIAHICASTSDGAILAFVPGLDEILKTKETLQARPVFGLNFGDKTQFKICLLHSTTPKEQQSEIFDATPPGCRKIILSTNIAETSVTVTDVKYVVDAGKLRENRYDQVRRITKLQCVWESKSNARQRAGRAGRVQDGFYYALFSKERSDSFRAVGLPELLRSDLQETCLAITALNFKEPVASFLAQAIEAPSKPAVDVAVENLKAIEAYTAGEELTALGRVLSRLPVHPSLGKMILLAVVFRCLDPILILGAAAEERSLFVTPIGAKSEADRAHRGYAGGAQSDHIALLEAFKELRLLRDSYGIAAAHQRARENFLHMGVFRTIDQTAKQIESILVQARLIPDPDDDLGEERKGPEYGPAALNRNAASPELIKCLLLAGFHPNLAAKLSSNGMTYRTPSEQNVLIHPSSLNNESKKNAEKHPQGRLFAYSTLARSNDGNTLFLRESTSVSPLMAVLFGGSLRMGSPGRLEMDEWLPFFVKSYNFEFSTKLILEYRKALDRILHRAFSSLTDVKAGNSDQFANDPIREQFGNRLVETLDHASGRHVRDDFAYRFKL